MKIRSNLIRFALLLIVAVSLAGCRGYRSEDTPFHFIINLLNQPKFNAQTLSLTPPQGAVAWGNNALNTEDESREQAIKNNTVFYYGKTADGKFVSRIPMPITDATLRRGQERFNIYCAVCHDQTGSGHGMVVQHGFLPPPVLWDTRVLAYSDGELFNVISNGIRNMPGYDKQIPEKDRWAIVAYVRAIQKSHQGTLADIPAGARVIQLAAPEKPKAATSDAKEVTKAPKSKKSKTEK